VSDPYYNIQGIPSDLINTDEVGVRSLKISLFDGFNNPIKSFDGCVNIHEAHPHSYIVNAEMHRHTATQTTLAVATSGSGLEYQITLTSAAGFTAGGKVHVGNGIREISHATIISVLGNVLTLDRRIDMAHAVGTPVTLSALDMSSIAGTLSTPVVYWSAPGDGEVWHIMRLLFSMVHGTAGDLGLFGNLNPLTNGCLLRVYVGGKFYTFTNWKTNSDISDDMYDVSFNARSGGGGQYGTSGRGTFYNTGAVVRLDGSLGDRIELWVQDNITALDSFTMKMQGHIEGA
jgi:hypothetical protein